MGFGINTDLTAQMYFKRKWVNIVVKIAMHFPLVSARNQYLMNGKGQDFIK